MPVIMIAFATHGIIRVIIRIDNKITHLTSISSQKIQLVDNKNMRDTLIDVHNYTAMTIILLDKNKTE